MQIKLVLFALIGLATLSLTAAIGQPTISIRTDDVDSLGKTNILPLLEALNSVDTRDMSHDGTGLKLAGIRFRSGSPPRINNTNTTIKPRSNAVCDNRNCWPDANIEWGYGYQPRNIGQLVCSWAAYHINWGVGMSGADVMFGNAICHDTTGKPVACTLVGGARVYGTTANTKSQAALWHKCRKEFDALSFKCPVVSGTSLCYVGSDDYSTGAVQYFAYPTWGADPASFGCDSSGANADICEIIDCNTRSGLCKPA